MDKEDSIFKTSRSNECNIFTNKSIPTDSFNLIFLRSSEEVAKSLKISPQTSSGWCPNGNGCPYDGCEKIDEYTVGGCPNDPNVPDKEEDYLYAPWYEWGPECTSDPDYVCRYVRTRVQTCWDGSSIWVADTEDCDGTPPEENCEPTGHGEGEAGFEFECTDGINNDCDEKTDCQERRCAVRDECLEECDVDRDTFIDSPCGGPDCFPNDPLLPVRINGQFVEQNCHDGRDDDCQGDGIDCYDSDCNTNPESGCPPSAPEQSNCYDDQDNDYDQKIDCYDSDCCGVRSECYQVNPECPPPNPTPTPTPDPNETPDPNGTPDPCQYDECCGRGTHTECTGGECDPDVEICDYIIDPYTGLPRATNCVTYPGECEPEWCFEVCN